jgi:hypothetical protein
MEELDGLRGGLLALLGLHQAEDDKGHDEKRDDQHKHPFSQEMCQKIAAKREIFAPENRNVISEFGAAGAICNQLKRIRARNSRIFA